MLDSLFAHNSEKIDLYMIYSNVSDENLEMLDVYMQEHGGRFIPVLVPENEAFQKAAAVNGGYPKEMFYRFLCSELLPDTLDRILYLDGDTIVQGELAPLYGLDFNGKSIAGVLDWCKYKHPVQAAYMKSIGLLEPYNYCNSGVLLFNLKKMRETFSVKEFLRAVEQHMNVIQLPDQDVMNLLFQNDILTVDCTYNYATRLLLTRDMPQPGQKNMHRVSSPVILHYVVSPKPWKGGYQGAFWREYYRYLKKYLTWKERIQRTVLRPYYVIKYTVWRSVNEIKRFLRSER